MRGVVDAAEGSTEIALSAEDDMGASDEAKSATMPLASEVAEEEPTTEAALIDAAVGFNEVALGPLFTTRSCTAATRALYGLESNGDCTKLIQG